ncbi:MAG: GH25 family lysozyme [Saprospiraceae bacterium]
MRTALWLCLFFILATCQRETARRDDYAVEGIDVSRYQAVVDWELIADQGMDFVFVKATEGATHSDPFFQENWQQIKDAGMYRGAYHFYRPRTPAVDQANLFVSKVKLTPGDLPPVLDIEVLDNVSPQLLVPALKTWLTLITRHYGVKPILYTNLSFYNQYLAGQFDEYPLWIARYSDQKPVTACGREWQFWQYGHRGTLEGIDGYVDLNVFNGSLEELHQLCYKNTQVSEKLH